MRKSLLNLGNLFWTQDATPTPILRGQGHYLGFTEPEREPSLTDHIRYASKTCPQYLSTPLRVRIPCDTTSVAAFGQVFEGLMPYILPYLSSIHLPYL